MTRSFTLLSWTGRAEAGEGAFWHIVGHARARNVMTLAAGERRVMVEHRLPVRRWSIGDVQVALLGRVFDASGGEIGAEAELLPSNSLRPSAVEIAKRVTERWWGQYLAVVLSPQGSWLMVDPSGAFQAHRLVSGGVTLVGTEVNWDTFASLGLCPQIDDVALARALVAPATVMHETHLRGVEPIVPGELIPLGVCAATTAVWSPTFFATGARKPDAALLAHAVGVSCRPLAAEPTSILLSGGLDSSIMVAACRAVGCETSAFNFATATDEGDEQRYAREVADLHNISLTMVRPGQSPDLARLTGLAHGPRPFVFGLDSAFEDAVAATARVSGISRIITGQGGDAVFFQPALPAITSDRLRRRGIRALAPRLLADDARRSRTSVLSLLKAALAASCRDPIAQPRRIGEHLLTQDARRHLGAHDPSHPWLRATGDLSAAKRVHVLLLAYAQIFMTPSALSPELDFEHPLLSQPVVEAMLPIAVSDLVYGRLDRQFARDVFAPVLPRGVTARRSKGDASNHYSRAVVDALPFLREYLLGGVLRSRGIVDTAAMEAALSPDYLFYSLDYRPIAIQVSCEAWARHWSGRA